MDYSVIGENTEIHELKVWPEFFNPARKGDKSFEYRKNDRNYNAGDILYLREWEPSTKQYTGRSLKEIVTYILKEGMGLPEEYVIMSTKIIDIPLYRLNYAVKIPVNGGEDDCFTDEYGHSKIFVCKNNIEKFLEDSDSILEDIEEL